MPGVPSKTFELEIGPLLPKELQGVSGDAIAPGLKDLLAPNRWKSLFNRMIVPLGLRWRVTPALGLPRGVFSVWRRHRLFRDPIDVRFVGDQVSSLNLGAGIFHLPSRPLYILQVSVRNTSTTSAVTVRALDTANVPLPFQTVQVPPNSLRDVRFQHPFLGGFSIRGGTPLIPEVTGVTMERIIAQTGQWELIDLAGLPAKTGEISGYDPGQQGDPSQLQDPPDAAFTRLRIAQVFYQNLPTTLPSGFSVPLWDIPEPNEAVDELRGGSPSLVQRLGEMFEAVDSGAVDSQAAFRTLETMPGVHQPGSPGAVTDNATMNVPLLSTVLLNAVTDPWFALSSGFGTTDFPDFLERSGRFIEPDIYFNVNYDYMVSAKFAFRLLGVDFSRELCALSHRSMFLPLRPQLLEASTYALNRPARRDDPWSAEISLTWNRIERLIQGNAVAVEIGGLTGAYLNSLRPASPSAKLALFVPARNGENSDPALETKNRFFDHGAQVPFEGTRTFRYGVAAMDVFARWSDWSTTQEPLRAQLPEAPRLVALALTPDTSRIVGNTAPHELSFEILWDWQDRSPKRFQLAGVFHARHTLTDGTTDSGHIPPTIYPAIFQTDNTVASGAFLELTFPSDSPPATPPAFNAVPTSSNPRATIELLPQATNELGQNVEGEMRRYRVKIPDLNVAFEPDEEWFFSLFIKAAEWRNPARLSDDTSPLPPGRPPRLTTYVPNPIPADPPVFVAATVLWASLPDARGVSRFRLAFDRVPNATGGYAIFRAYETKLRELAELPVVDDVDLVARATDLRDLAMPLARCLDGFSRLNSELIPQPPAGVKVEFEAELPGTLDGLAAFAVKSVTREQESSALSTPWLFVAVPRRAVPAMPLLGVAEGGNGIATLTCDFAKAPTPAHVEILRARREFAARDAGTMGLPVIDTFPAAWEALDDQGRPAAGADVTRFRFSFSDSTPPSWFPYLYRAVSVGARDDSTGLVPGRSVQSNLVSVERLPTTLPAIEDLAFEQAGPLRIKLRFRSTAEVVSTPHGNFRLEVSAYDFAGSQFAADPVLNVLLPLVEPLPTAGGSTTGVLYASAPDAIGERTFETLLNLTGQKFMFRVRLTDPLNRSSERIISGSLPANDAPNLSDLDLRSRLRDLLVRFRSSSPTQIPPFGEFRVEISFIRSTGGLPIRLMLTAALHEIKLGNLNALGTQPNTTILRSSSIQDLNPPLYGAVIKRFFPPVPLPPIRGRVRVRLTAPDGTSTVLETEL